MQERTQPGELITVSAAAALLAVDARTIRRWIREGRLPARLMGSSRAGYRIDREEVERVRREGLPRRVADD